MDYKKINYKLVAIRVGDLLKYDTSINEINRIAKSIFEIEQESFPNDSITSARAQTIYNWILSLAKQKIKDDEKVERWLQFFDAITPEKFKKDIEKILKECGFHSALAPKDDREQFLNRKFHSQVIKHAKKLFLQGNYFHAVFEVSKAYNNAVKNKAKIHEDGQSLMMSVWGCKNGVLKITKCESETDQNVQDGIKFLSSGLMRAVRNPTSHEPAVEWPIDKQDCLDILSFISFLFRKLDEAVYYESNNN